MTFAHSARRGIATATGGLVVIGAGTAAGLIIADMQATWADEAALETASAVAAQPADVAPVRPVVVTHIEEHHVTPEPVIVRKKVYRTRIVGGGSGQAPQRAAPQRTTSNGTTRAPAPAPKPQKPTRTVVAPAPKAPAASSGGASSGTTSKSS